MRRPRPKISAYAWWSAPRIFEGRTVFIIGGGPSLEGFDFNRLIPHATIGCNDAYSLGVDVAKVCVFGDYGWWLIHWKDRVVCPEKGRDHPGLIQFKGVIVTNCPHPAVRNVSGINVMHRCLRGHIDKRSDILGWYHNTGAAAIHLAYLMGASTAVLLGYDMKRKADRLNWHHAIKPEPGTTVPGKVDLNLQASNLRRQMQGHAALRKDMTLFGIFPDRFRVVNATPDSDLDVWDKGSLDTLLEGPI